MVSEAHVQLTDSDGDGLYDSDETARGTNPNKSDSDSDGIPDGWEVTYGLNPLTNDASGDKDYDGITNLAEYTAKTNPNKIQTDLVLKNMTITTGNTKEYRATNSITSGPAFIINSGANVTFQAGNKIKLIAGFKAQEGSKFKAYLK